MSRRIIGKVALALGVLLTVNCGLQLHGEAYMHDPMDNPEVLRDTVRAPGNVFGFAPAKRDKDHPNSTLYNFAKARYNSFETVGRHRQTRIAYHEFVVEQLDEIMAQNISLEEKAKAAIRLRNEARLRSYLDAKGNIKPGMKPGHKAALERSKKNTYEYFREVKGLTDEEIIQSAYGSNAGMDAVLGLYDRHFAAYKILVPSQVVKSLNPVEKEAYDRLYARFVKMSLKKRDSMSYLYFMEPKTAAKLIVHLANWYNM